MDNKNLTPWRDTYRALQDERSERCPDDARLASLAVGEVSGSERDALADHVVSCRSCSGKFRDLAQLHEGAAKKTPRVASRRWWGVAALLVVAVLAVVAARPTAVQPGGEGLRGGSGIGAPVRPADRAALAAPPDAIEWQPIDGAESYQLLLFDREGGAIWQSQASDRTAVDLPPAVRDRISPPGPYLWRVRYVVGLERLETDLRRFTLNP